jgi:putative nucleotidyltransferase with HDIG domain
LLAIRGKIDAAQVPSSGTRSDGREADVSTQPIRLRGISGEIKGKVWEANEILRAGRLATLEIVLDDNSVSRRHAELRAGETGWIVRDLESTNGTYVNGQRITGEDRLVRARDIVQFGKVALIVEMCDTAPPESPSSDHVLVEAATASSWDDAVGGLVFDRNRCLRPGEQLLALLRAGYSLVHQGNEDELFHHILNDAVAVLDAQRGAVVLAEGPANELKLRALATGKKESHSRTTFSQKLANRCYSRGESILCTSVNEDAELKVAQSIADGAMASVLCVLLRTPRKRLGVLHLDRGPWQKPFTEDDLHLADALAASVSAAIESAQLLRKQRDLFLNTITILAQAVELRDEYTGGHTARVTSLACLLGKKLDLPAEDMELLRLGTPLHDIGKIGIDDAILRKPGRLTAEEFAVMQSHTVKGAAIVATIPDLHPIIPIVRSHHERWDGQGYPDRLAGEDIPLLARIVAVADAYDAMTSNRPYHADRKGRPPEMALAELQKQAGRQFDPACVEAFLAIQDQVAEAIAAHTPPLMVTEI